jgi:phosphate transport system permease protein
MNNVSTATALLGDNTLLVGGQGGNVVGTFIANELKPDGARFDAYVGAHPFRLGTAPIRLIAASPSSRMFAAIDEQSKLTLCYAPNDAVLNANKLDLKDPKEMWFSIRQDKVGVLANDELKLFDLAVAYPEASFKSLFLPVWYEGYSKPESIWQSSSAGVDAESKLSMRPLIFGTLKATFFSLLIAVPLALMAAIYSSEFLSTPVRLRVKPVIELMAGIPSVVLGFIAAFVLARIFREHLMTILLSFFTLMFTLGLFGNLWMLLPQQIYLRLERFRILLLLIVVPLGISLAWFIAPAVEHLLFGGSLIEWLSGPGDSSAWPGWFMLLVPLSIIAVIYFSSTVISSILRPLASRWSAKSFALLMVARFLMNCTLMVLLAAVLASLLTMIGWDPRGTFYGTYQERNALLVGAILGFAIIPIIYTISEDALQAVPQHLRSASLGCGATPWQTTTRIVLPTAMSGLFGGVMIGFGRAVGETMVVLMAAGNTPVMDINPFNGYRTLSATLATELPEAARASAHFHTLFLAAFLLFCFTLVANTLAEFVRMRFRKRSFQL